MRTEFHEYKFSCHEGAHARVYPIISHCAMKLGYHKLKTKNVRTQFSSKDVVRTLRRQFPRFDVKPSQGLNKPNIQQDGQVASHNQENNWDVEKQK